MISRALTPDGSAGFQLRERLRDLFRQLHRVDIELLLDRDDHGGLAHVAGVAPLDFWRKLDARHLPQQDRASLDGGDDDVAQIFQAGGAADVADEIFAGILVGVAAAGVGAELPQRLLDLLIADAERAQRRGQRRDAVLTDFAADRDHLRDAGDRQQARPDGEVGDLAHFHRRGRLRGHRDQQDLAHDRTDGADLRGDVERQLALHLRETFRDQLAVAVDIGAPIELDIDDRKPDAGDRSYPAHTRHAVHLGFDRKTDELLDFRRRIAFRLRHDGDGRTVEVGEYVDRQLARGIGAENDEDGCDRQNQQAIAERGADQECEHEPVLSARDRAGRRPATRSVFPARNRRRSARDRRRAARCARSVA